MPKAGTLCHIRTETLPLPADVTAARDGRNLSSKLQGEVAMPQMTGGCLCGKVRYTANAEPIFIGVCHCTNCQKQSGTAFSVVVAIPKSALSITGTTKSFQDKPDSGQPMARIFCPECGSPIMSDATVLPDVA